ncbi:MAG: hypothetical protein K6F58_05645 [Bacteroidales bacterium]|nr:hypothetical protein [Bacteroidales bacterium]
MIDYSSVTARINGKECRMFSGYNCEPVNRTFVGQEYLDNVLLRFESLNMAEHYKSTNSRDNDTVYVIRMSVLAKSYIIKPFCEVIFDEAEEDSNDLNSAFEKGEIVDEPKLSGQVIVSAIHKGLGYTEWIFSIASGVISFGEMLQKPHMLYGGERLVWKCEEAFFKFDAVSDDGKILHVTDGYCKL